MEDTRVGRIEEGQAKIRNVPIAVTPYGFRCCPSPAVLQKTLKNHNHQNKPKASAPLSSNLSLVQRTATAPLNKKPHSNSLGLKIDSDDQGCPTAASAPTMETEKPTDRSAKPTVENREVSVGYGQPETSDLKVILFGREGIHVRICMHWKILTEHSNFFAVKLSKRSPSPCVEILDLWRSASKPSG